MPRLHPNNPSRRHFLASSAMMGAGALIATSSQAGDDVPLAPPDKQPIEVKTPEPVPHKVGWAIVGLGKLALEEIMPAFGSSHLARPVALVSGHPDKAKQVAKVHGVDPKNTLNYENFDRIADNPEIEAVYIVLPNSMHAEFTIRALQAGKHVLCEKPMAATVIECEQMIAAASKANRKLMIAYRLRYEPFNQKVIALCEQKTLGHTKVISASNSQNIKAPNIRLSKKLAGGPIGDVGIYCLNAARYITQQEPVEVCAFTHQPESDPRFREVPESASFILRFPDGTIAHNSCSFGTGENRFYSVECTEGVIELDEAFGYRGQKLWIKNKSGNQLVKIEPVNHFAAEMDHFSDCILTNKDPRTPGAEGLADMRVITAIEESAKSGRSIRLST